MATVSKMCKYYVIACVETDMLDGVIIHINEKVKNINEALDIMQNNADKYLNGIWILYQNQIKI